MFQILSEHGDNDNMTSKPDYDRIGQEILDFEAKLLDMTADPDKARDVDVSPDDIEENIFFNIV
jgi:endothelin-converting enzyme